MIDHPGFWIIVFLLVAVPACSYAAKWILRPKFDVRAAEFAMETVEALPTVSLAALLRDPPRLDADLVAAACARAWGGTFNHSEHDVRFVMGEPPVLMIRDARLYYMLNTGDEPYLDNRESNLAQVDDAALRRAAYEHRGWISMDFLEEAGGDDELRETARANIARLIGELLPELTPLAVIVPAEDRALGWSEELGKRLREGRLDA
ncbi:MAG: hypothetical protein QM811_24710 [Pirellulales bacterium]